MQNHILNKKLIKKNKKISIDKLDEESKAAKIPKKFFTLYNIDTLQIEGRNVYILSPKENVTKTHIIYIHGGSYVNNLLSFHWKGIGKIVDETNVTIVVPDYPLAPQHQVLEGMAFMDKVYDYSLQIAKSENIILMGDSAGGGFSLAFAQKLKKDEKETPSQLILLAPWLDISCTNPEIDLIEKKDPFLIVDYLKIKGKSWAGDIDIKNHIVSPLYGEFDEIGDISIFIGGDDVLFSDVKKLKIKMEEQNIPLNYYEYPKMFHVWMLVTFLKESKIAINQIAKIINNN